MQNRILYSSISVIRAHLIILNLCTYQYVRSRWVMENHVLKLHITYYRAWLLTFLGTAVNLRFLQQRCAA